MKGEEFRKRIAESLAKGSNEGKPSSEDDETYYDKQIRRARARRELEEEERRLKDLDKQPESPFSIRGGVDLGTINVQEERQRREAEMEQERQAAAQRAQQTEEENKNLKEQMYQERIESLRRDFQEKMDALQKTIQSGGSQKSFSEQYNELLSMAKEMGLEKTDTGQDPMIQLELAKLNYQQAKEDREFKWKMKQDDKQFQLEMQKMQDEREHRKAELAQQAKKDEMFASFPQRLGGAIAKGMMEGEEEEGISAPATKRKEGGKAYHIEIGEGEAGEIPCPNCDTPVGVGPSSKAAVCVDCGSKFRVDRKSAEPAEEETENA